MKPILQKSLLYLLFFLCAATVLLPVAVYAENIASGTSGTCDWVIDENGVLTISPTDGVQGELEDSPKLPLTSEEEDNASTLFALLEEKDVHLFYPWHEYGDAVTEVVVSEGVCAAPDSSFLFNDLSVCTKIDLRGLDTTAVTKMRYWFMDCTALTDLTLGEAWSTANVTTMAGMFYNCTSMLSVDLSGWNTANVTDMSRLFLDCSSLTALDFENGWDTSAVNLMSGMFYGCSSLTGLTFGEAWDTANVIDLSSLFYGCSGLTDSDLVKNWNTASAVDMTWMFAGCSSLTALNFGTGWNTSNVVELQEMFRNCTSLRKLDLSGWNTANATNAYRMFFSCKALARLTVGTSFTVAPSLPKKYSSTADYEVHTAVVPGVAATYVPYLPGDVNLDRQVDVRDAVLLSELVNDPDVVLPLALDFDGNGAVDDGDAGYLFDYAVLPLLYPLFP